VLYGLCVSAAKSRTTAFIQLITITSAATPLLAERGRAHHVLYPTRRDYCVLFFHTSHKAGDADGTKEWLRSLIEGLEKANSCLLNVTGVLGTTRQEKEQR
jgi:hypothetical protein